MRNTFGTVVIVVLGLVSLCFNHMSRGYNMPNPQDTITNILRDTLGIKEVTVQGKALTPEERLKQRQEEYRIIYLHGDNSNIAKLGTVRLSENFSLPLPVLIVNINNLYNHFSASGKQVRRFQEVLIDDYEKDKIEQVWLPLTAEHTKLQGQDMEDFRRYYEPQYPWIIEAEEWEKLDYVFKKLKNYQDSSEYIREYLRLP